MLNEETELEFEQPQVEELQRLDTEDDSKITGLFTTEASLSEAVDTVLSNIDDLSTVEETVTTHLDVHPDENSQEKDVNPMETSDGKEQTDEEKLKTDQTISKPSRELKLLLELSKEANLDTNIPYKRKSLDPSKHIEHQDHRYASLVMSQDAKRSMRSQNPDFVVKHQKFLSKLTSDGEPAAAPDNEEKVIKEKTQKKIREYLTIGGAIDEKTRKLLKPAMALVKNNKDGFCWRCHREGITLSCETCPRSYHLKCLKHGTINMDHWACPECVAILNAENTKTRSPALKDMSLEQLCGLLKFALKRMAQCNDSYPFLRPVNETEFPDYKKYIVQPMDLSRIQRNIRDNLYGSTNAFEADAKWLVHNSIIFNSYQSKLTTIAKSLLKVCKQEMSEIENCPTCYLNANTNKNWFVEVCPKPHVLLWAKLKGFPYWPAKAMSTNSQGMVDVRFFGAHDRAWVPFKECFLYSIKDPNSHKQMKNDIIACVKELELHIENLKSAYGEFNYAPYRTPYDPENEVQQLQLLLPTYKPAYHTSTPRKFLRIDSLLKKKTVTDKPLSGKQSPKTPTDHLGMDKLQTETKEMVGYGTDEEMEIVTEERIKIIPRQISGSQVRPSPINSQTSRRNSDQSTKSDMSRVSNISEKANPIDFSEQMDTDLSNDEFHRSSTDSLQSPEQKKSTDTQQSPELKKSSESHSNTLRISEKLMKRLSETSNKGSDDNKMDTSEIEETANDTFESLMDELGKSVIESENLPSRSDINEVILGNPTDTIQPMKINQNNPTDNCDSVKDKQNEKKESSVISQVENLATLTLIKKTNTINPGDGEKKSPTDTNTIAARVESQNSDDLLEEMYSVAVDASGLSNKEKERNKDEEVASDVNATNKRKRTDENENNESNTAQSKFIKVVDINVIRKLQSGGTILINPQDSSSILKSRLATAESSKISVQAQNPPSIENAPPTTIEIKSEPTSDAENDHEDIEAKKQYLSALNISEKIKKVIATTPTGKESRVKTRTDTNSNKNLKAKEGKSRKTVEGSGVSQEKKDTLPRLIKQLPPKQRARKSFPRPINSSPKHILKNDNVKVAKAINPNPPPKSTPLESQPNNSNVVILTQPQSVVNSLTVLPSNPTLAYTTNMGNPILTMVQPTQFSNFIVPTTSLNPVPPLNPISERVAVSGVAAQGDSQSTLTLNGLLASANAIFTSSAQDPSSCSTTSTLTLTTSTVMNPISSASTASSSGNINTITILNGQAALPALIGGKPPSTDINEDYSYLSGYVPDNISKSISELIHRAPPKLKPRPPGPLSTSYETGLPSSAGRVTSVINSVAHKLTDYFRGMLVETINDLGTMGNTEATITNLRLENEKLRHKHAEEILEIKKNVNSILRDIQKSIIDERERVIEETRSVCETETIKRIEEAKSKQWCANCMKEAQFYCCWNTSYCDYPCQLRHWPKHMSKCTQNTSASQDNPAMAKLVTPFILRKTAPPKNFTGKPTVTKSSKEVLCKSSPNKAAPGTLKTPTANAATLVDTSKQWTFDVKPSQSSLQSTATSMSSNKVLNFNKIKSVSMLTPSTSNSSSVIITTPTQKFIVTPTMQKTAMDID